MELRNADSRAGDGLPFNAASSRHTKIALTTANVLLRPSSMNAAYHLRLSFAIGQAGSSVEVLTNLSGCALDNMINQ